MIDRQHEECATAVVPGETESTVAAELRSKGLSVIAATLEGTVATHVCAVIQPGNEERWRLALETDIVGLVQRRHFHRELTFRLGPGAEKPDPKFHVRMI
jgi:hypothetical protein